MSYGFIVQVHYRHPVYGPRLETLVSTAESFRMREQLRTAFDAEHNQIVTDAFTRAAGDQDGTGFSIPLIAVLDQQAPAHTAPALLVRPDHSYDDPGLIAQLEDMRVALERIRADVADHEITLFVSAQ